MATIENKVFKSLLNSYVVEIEHGEYLLYNAEDDLFFFRYQVSTDAIEGGYELSEGQAETMKNTLYDYHLDNQLEEEDESFAEFPIFI